MNVFQVIKLPDLFTLLNAVFGFLALLAAADTFGPDRRALAVLFILFAALMDGADGFIARRFGSSPIGASLDSLADLASFGIAPAFFAFINAGASVPAAFAAILFLICGTLRLARFNVSAKNEHLFEGLPIPMAGIAICASALFKQSDFAVIFMLIMSMLMVSSIPYPKIKNKMIFLAVGLMAVMAAFLVYIQNDIFPASVILMATMLLYLLSPVVILRETKGKRKGK